MNMEYKANINLTMENEDKDVIDREMATYRFIYADTPKGECLVLQYFPEVRLQSLNDLYLEI